MLGVVAVKRKSTKRSAAKPAKLRARATPVAGAAVIELEKIAFETAAEWRRWLERNHGSSPGVWVRFAKKNSSVRSITYLEAVDGALRWGWIDGQSKPLDDQSWLQRYTPRRARSIWSKINRDKALALIERGEMKAPGLAEIERARGDGRWDAAYDSPKNAAVPEEFAKALASKPRAAAFYAKLNAANRYAILWRLQTAKRPETKKKRIEQFIAMLLRGEKLHP
jgi:uncharacterized protein YdeI (YjbR/CyaY-like superfamily)